MSEPPDRGCHDIGGLPGGPVACVEREFDDWQKLAEAIRGALEQRSRRVDHAAKTVTP